MVVPIYYSDRYSMDFSCALKGYSGFRSDLPHLRPYKGKSIRKSLEEKALPLLFVEPKEAARAELLAAHTPEYLESLRNPPTVLSIFELPKLNFDLDDTYVTSFLDRGILRPARNIVGGTLEAVLALQKFPFVVNLGGGYHHASAEKGEGFCPYNDVAVAIKNSWKHETPRKKFLIIDLDAHHGNGNALIFADEPSVFTFSIHEEGIYPSQKPASSLDVAVGPGTGGQAYSHMLSSNLAYVLDSFNPDYIIYIAGADVLEGDPLTNFKLSKQDVIDRDEFVLRVAKMRGIPLCYLTAGGYSDRSAEVQAESIANLVKKFSS